MDQINAILLFTSVVDIIYLAVHGSALGWLYAPTTHNLGYAFSIINVISKVCFCLHLVHYFFCSIIAVFSCFLSDLLGSVQLDYPA